VNLEEGGHLVLQAGQGNVGIGTFTPNADNKLEVNGKIAAKSLQLLNANTDARGSTLVLGPADNTHLRLGYNSEYTWVQSHNGKPLLINMLNVGTNHVIVGDWTNIGTKDAPVPKVKTNLYVTGDFFYYLKDRTFWFRLYGEGSGYAYTTPDSGPSDIRFKTAVRPIGNALEKVLQLSGTRYRWGEAGLAHFTRHISDQFSVGPDATADDNQKLWDAERQKAYQALSGDKIGLIAQEVETVVPELVHEDKEGYKYIQYPQLTALLVEAIKEQNAMIQSLSGRLTALEAR
jgi:hypothetical protein